MRRKPRLPIATLSTGGRSRQRSRRRRRRIFTVVLLLLAGAGAWWWLSDDSHWPRTTSAQNPLARSDLDSFPLVEPVPAAETGEGAGGSPKTRFELSSDKGGTKAETAPDESPRSPAFERNFEPRMPRDVFEAQVALARDAIDPGAIDGAWGNQTRMAVIAFQQKHGLRVTGQLDNATREALELTKPPIEGYTITPDDHLRLRPIPSGWVERAAVDRLDYSSILELVAEQHWSHPNLIRKLNPDIDFAHAPAGTVVAVPAVSRQPPASAPASIVIQLSDKTLEVFDADQHLLAHFPCSIARRVEKRPVGDLEVTEAVRDPNYTFDPETFPDSAEAQRIGRKLVLNPGPNNPVGSAWIGLSLPGYGIHGTPEPEKIGRTESSGCFRLSNWNANYLLTLVFPGMPVHVEP